MRFKYMVALAVGAVILPGVARAHVEMLSPPPRQPGQAGGTQLKLKPCGQTTNKRTEKVTTFAPGEKVEVKMKEYIDHPGYFAVTFDDDGDDSFIFPRANMDDVVPDTDDPKALFPVDGIKVLGLRTDKEKNCASEPDQTCSISITIPNLNCQNCTLQLTQFMYDKVGNNKDDEYYYQCADIKVEGPLQPAGGAGGGGGGGAAAGAGGEDGTTGGTAGSPNGGSPSGGSGGGGPSSGGSSGASGSTSGGGAPSSGGSVAGGASTSGAGGSAAQSVPAPDDESGCAMRRPSGGVASLLAAVAGYLALRRRRTAT